MSNFRRTPHDDRKPPRGTAGHQRGRLSILLIGLGAIAVMGVMATIGYRAADTVPGRSYYNIKAEFNAADNLSNHYEVRIGGERAGQVLKPRVRDGKALVDVRLDAKFKPLRSDSKTRIRLRSAVGVRYLEIIPGKKGAPLAEGDTIPAENAIEPVALDQALSTFDPETRQETQRLLRELGGGATDAGDDINRSLKDLPPFLSKTQSVSKAINARPQAMRGFVRGTASTADAFDPIRDTLAAMFGPTSKALQALSEAEDGLGSTFDETAPTMAQVNVDLPKIDRLVTAVDRLAVAGRPALRAMPASLRETHRLMTSAPRPLKAVTGTLQKAEAAVDPTLATLTDVERILPEVDKAFDSAQPLVDELGPRACEITNFSTGWSEMMKYSNTGGGFIRFEPVFNIPDTLEASTGTRFPIGEGGRPLFDHMVNTVGYPGPCEGHKGQAGWLMPRVAESMKGLVYDRNVDHREQRALEEAAELDAINAKSRAGR
ncbi:MAG: MlaD family protein [Solirubrobacteraceae bacterium]|nr:MlaD family protein [Solirubrobacteraceae bacterium]